MMMPEMDGWEFSEELKAHPELGAPPVIYVSAAEGSAHHLRPEDHARFVVKPFDLDRLLSVLRASLSA
jgi:CheY-like chemotaxis protein